MDYLVKASGLVIILLLFYNIFLKNETFFKSIRSYFLIGLIVVLSFPLVEIPVYVESATLQLNINNFEISTNAPTNEQPFDWLQLFTLIYLAGILFFSLKFLSQLISLAFLLSKHQLIKKGNYYFVETSKNISPFSFFNIIIYNNNQFSIQELAQIINHEKAHAIQWHSVDTILAHLLVITLWFNPFVWLYKKAVQQNLEFLADAYALQKANNQKLYQLTLLKTCSSNYCPEITNNFYNSLIKKRIIMLHKNQSNTKSQWKYVLLLPVLLAFLFTFNTKVVAQEKKHVKVEESKVELIIDKNTTDTSITQETKTFKNEFNIDLSFKGIKRNSNNEIIAIKIGAKGNNMKTNFANSGTEPIKPILITYDSKNNVVHIGNLNNKTHFSYTIHEDHDNKIKGKPNKDGNYVFITSDGKTKSWTSKKSNKIIHENNIIIKSNGDKEHVWVHKNDDDVNIEVIEIDKDGKKLIKVIENEHDTDIDTDYNIEIIESDDDASKNVFIIKKDGDQTFKIKEDNASENVFLIEKDTKGDVEKKVIKTNFISSDSTEKPLIIMNGKEISFEEMEKITPDNIESIHVLKGDSATKKYGNKGKNGVIEITKKQ